MQIPSSEVVLRPNQSWVQIGIREIHSYRDLLYLLVTREFVTKYKQTLLGPAWFVINPLVTTFVFLVVFNKVIGVKTDQVPPALFYLCGLLGWSYFAGLIGATGNTLAGNAGLFSKVYFPRLIPPLAVSIANLINVVIQFGTFLVVYAVYWFQPGGPQVAAPTWLWLLLPLTILHVGILGLGVGLLMSSFTAKYRDLAHLQAFLLQIWLYATPVIYPLSRVPEEWRWVAMLNPMTAVVDTTRAILLNVGVVTPQQYLLSIGITVVFFFLGLFAYQRTARTFVDTV